MGLIFANVAWCVYQETIALCGRQVGIASQAWESVSVFYTKSRV